MQNRLINDKYAFASKALRFYVGDLQAHVATPLCNAWYPQRDLRVKAMP